MSTLLRTLALLIVCAAAAAAQEKAVHTVLDDFHDAAAKADFDRYFGHFTEDGIFLGTDPTERWTVEQFKKYARPHFRGKSAWTYVPRDRKVILSPEGTCAWFDETVVNARYGACRGTGVVRKVHDTWKVAHYNLTLPIPNDIFAPVAKMVLAHGKKAEVGPTTVFVVRHAEKQTGSDDPDPPLTPAGEKRAAALARVLAVSDIAAVYASEYKRTQLTVAPTAKARGVKVTVVSARDPRGLAARLREVPAGKAALVAGHSNTVPAVLRALGVRQRVRMTDSDYGDLFVVTLMPGAPPAMLQLKL